MTFRNKVFTFLFDIYIYTYIQFKPRHRTKVADPSLDAGSLNTARGVLDRPAKETAAAAEQCLDKSLRDGVRSRGARVRVAGGVERIDLGLAQGLEDVGGVLSVVNEHGIGSDTGSRALGVSRITARRVGERSSLPRVVGRRRADDDLCALCRQLLARVGEIGWVGEHGDGLPVVDGLASLGPSTGADGTSAVAGGKGAPIVMTELDDHDVVGLDKLCGRDQYQLHDG